MRVMYFTFPSISSDLVTVWKTEIDHSFTNEAVVRAAVTSQTIFMCSYEIGGTTTYFDKEDGTNLISVNNSEEA